MKDNKYMYLNDIKGCEITAIYECGTFIELQYVKNDIQKCLVFEYHFYGGSMGYGSFFRFSGVELALWNFQNSKL